MQLKFPAAVPEIPAADVDKAVAYYVGTLGFTLDFGGDEGGIAGISRGECRLFITNLSFREHRGNTSPILFWLNLHSKGEVDELFAEWKAAGAKIVSEPEDKEWKLREFVVADLDGNWLRVFHDFSRDVQGGRIPSGEEQGANAHRGVASMITAEPQLYVTDLGAALAFYSGKLGFEIAVSYGDPPFWAQVVRDGARLNMRAVDGPVFDSRFREREDDPISVTLALDDAEPLYLEFKKKGVAFHQELRTEEWGARTFIVRDPSGNLILFAGDGGSSE